MLLQDFYSYQVLEGAENLVNASISFNAAHDIFKGHFPGTPVVPGVCMMQVVKEMLEQNTSRQLQLQKASHLKFLAMIVPTITPTVNLKLSYTIKENIIDTQAELFTSEQSFFKMKGSFITIP